MKMNCTPGKIPLETKETHDELERQETSEVYFVATLPAPGGDNPSKFKTKKKRQWDYFEPAQPQGMYDSQGKKWGKEKPKDQIIEFVNKAYQESNKK